MTGESIPVVVFRCRARFGHFLRAEASVSALTYPAPPRTALLGMIGAVLGLAKDTPQVELKDSRIAVSGPVPRTHWHRVKLRKDPPAPLSDKIKKGAKGSSAPEKATLIKQEWLFEPDYEVTASLPVEYHREFVGRIRERRWHYSPCMGLSEMIADLGLVSEGTANPLPSGSEVECRGVIRRDEASVNGRRALEAGEPLAILPQRMPREVTPERVFTHADYLIERSGLPMPLLADSAWQVIADEGTRVVVFL
ncbi:MAG: CRISPR-associated protein Cas5 [Rubrobacteraceae bacterium]